MCKLAPLQELRRSVLPLRADAPALRALLDLTKTCEKKIVTKLFKTLLQPGNVTKSHEHARVAPKPEPQLGCGW
jgi:hypothetical protein